MTHSTHPVAELLTVGNELLQGNTLNTNTLFLGRELTTLGFEVKHQSACQDHQKEIIDALSVAWDRSELVLVSGGLGPTPDDLTRQALAKFFHSPLRFSARQYQMIKRLYRRYHKKAPSLVKIEAHFPEIAVPLFNRHGVALGFFIFEKSPRRLLIALPGVPYELEKMFRELVRPLLIRKFPATRPKYSLTAALTGISEPEVMKKLGRDFFSESFEFGIYPEPNHVTLRLKAETGKIIERLKRKIRLRLGGYLYRESEGDLAESVGEMLKKRRKTLAVAESSSGGLLSYLLTSHPGASDYFKGSITAYANSVKEDVLEVAHAQILKAGAVSATIALGMAEGIRRKMKADFGISITGIAGPSGGSKRKPVGLVYIGLASEKFRRTWRHHFPGDRKMVQMRSARKALEYLWRHLK
ncbi:MAG: CinA family nicotinamide mononucleotide deamidase-related protein [Candidatus Omnitrophica bacterium]|nr:CinA family nicotinamide mononucleotide deamidase-related protein [Candidatus Omnitrophota bacterium]